MGLSRRFNSSKESRFYLQLAKIIRSRFGYSINLVAVQGKLSFVRRKALTRRLLRQRGGHSKPPTKLAFWLRSGSLISAAQDGALRYFVLTKVAYRSEISFTTSRTNNLVSFLKELWSLYRRKLREKSKIFDYPPSHNSLRVCIFLLFS